MAAPSRGSHLVLYAYLSFAVIVLVMSPTLAWLGIENTPAHRSNIVGMLIAVDGESKPYNGGNCPNVINWKNKEANKCIERILEEDAYNTH